MENSLKRLAVAVAVAFAVGLAVPAKAQDQSRPIDMTVLLRDEHGHPFKDFADQEAGDNACAKCAALTMGRAIDHALKAAYADEQNLSGDQKWARAKLGDKIRDEKAARLTVKEAETIERLVMKAFNGEVIAQIIPVLDPNRKPPELQ